MILLIRYIPPRWSQQLRKEIRQHISVWNNQPLVRAVLQFVSDLTMVSKKYDNKPLQDFILLSPAPVDVASKLSYILYHLSMKVSYARKTWMLSKDDEQ